MTSPPSVLRRPDRLYDGYVVDLDGTVYLGSALLPGAGGVITEIRARGILDRIDHLLPAEGETSAS